MKRVKIPKKIYKNIPNPNFAKAIKKGRKK